MLIRCALTLIHLLYIAYLTISTSVQRRKRRKPEPLQAQRDKIPKHLCLNLIADNDMPAQETQIAFLQCLQSVATWCRVLGIEALTVYDRHGVIFGCSENAYRHVFLVNEMPEDGCASEVKYPLMPAPSEASGLGASLFKHEKFPADLNVTRLSVLPKHRNGTTYRQLQGKGVSSASNILSFYIASRPSGKPAIVSASRWLLQNHISDASMPNSTIPSGVPFSLTVSELATVLEAGLPPPDLMIIHHIGSMKVPYPPIEFQGFPPWQSSLTEFHRTHPDDREELDHSRSESPGTPVLISETAFCRILDEYSKAEFRRGG